jgi:hypothetical protein
MLGSLFGSDPRARAAAEPMPWSVGAGERWLLVGERLGELANRILEASDADLTVVSPRMSDFESLRGFKSSWKRYRLTFLCAQSAGAEHFEPQSFDGVATTHSGFEFQRFLRPGGRFVRLSS